MLLFIFFLFNFILLYNLFIFFTSWKRKFPFRIFHQHFHRLRQFFPPTFFLVENPGCPFSLEGLFIPFINIATFPLNLFSLFPFIKFFISLLPKNDFLVFCYYPFRLRLCFIHKLNIFSRPVSVEKKIFLLGLRLKKLIDK